MTKLTYRVATLDDAVSLSSRLRPEDATEVRLGTGRPAEEVLVESVAISEVAEAAVVDGVVIAIRGISLASLPGNAIIGVPWMLCSPDVLRWSKRMVKDAIEWVAHHGNTYHIMGNMVHAENTKALGWLKHIGFTIGNLYPEWGVGKAPFYQFYRYNK